MSGLYGGGKYFEDSPDADMAAISQACDSGPGGRARIIPFSLNC